MNRKLSYVASCVIAFLLVVGAPMTALAEGFYQGKTIRIIVGASPGGGFDTFSRMLARHIPKYIAGKPSVIVQNMPGAGTLVAANHVYALQPGDGLTMVVFNASFINQSLLKNPVVKFDPQKYIWLGQPSVGALPQVLWVRPEVVETFDGLLQTKNPVNLGSLAPGDSMFEMAEYYKKIGLNVKNISGYKGSARVFAAVERGEVDGLSISLSTVRGVYSRFLEQKKIVPILSLGEHPLVKPLPGVANFDDLVKRLNLSATDAGLGRFLINNRALLRLFAVPPGTPPDRAKILQDAFMKSFDDPKLLEEAKRIRMLVAPLSARELEERVAELMKTPPEILEAYQKTLLPK